mmetsp:Transcript_16558/g.35828  ORF Transcript_16558/g.35828 Transcript_16558/m.35828 type:complete len:150 (-) Transcript_16558:926-1375(-)
MLSSPVAVRALGLGLIQSLAPVSSAAALRNRSYATGSSPVVNIKDDKEFGSLIKTLTENNNQLAVVDFTAQWCGPCRAIAPIFEKLSKENPAVKFVKVDIDVPGLQGTVTEHGITGVPTFVFYKGSKRVEAFSGARPDLLKDLLLKHAK